MHPLPEPIAHALEAGVVPSPPQVLLRLMQKLDDPDCGMAELAGLIEQDSGLSTRILGVANSPAFRRGRELRSIEHCLMTLGTRLVHTLATCLSLRKLLEPGGGINAKSVAAYWGHALLVGELARDLALACRYPQPAEAYLAGLLHDIGELLLLGALRTPYAMLLVANPAPTREAAETARFGVSHSQIACWLIERWQLDSALADGILFHHADGADIASAAPLSRLVWLAESLADSTALADSQLTIVQSLCPGSTADDLLRWRDQAEMRSLQMASALELDLPPCLAGQSVWAALPAGPAPAVATPERDLAIHLGGMALLQPLQEDLLAVDEPAVLLFAVREAASILFGLQRTAFLLCTPEGDALSGEAIGGQPALFRQIRLALADSPALAARAARERALYSTARADYRPTLIDEQLRRALGATPDDALLCLPLCAAQGTQGVMLCALSPRLHTELEACQPWLLRFASVAARSLQALQAMQNLRQQSLDEAAARHQLQARRIVHEAGNPLGIIQSYLKILERSLPTDAVPRKELDILGEEIQRVARIVGRLSEVPAEDTAGDGSTRLDRLLREMEQLYGEALFRARGIVCELELPPRGLDVACPRDSLKQIVLNLWKNAGEALSSGQRVSVRASDPVLVAGQPYCQLTIEDNGPGLPEATLRRMQQSGAAPGAGARGHGLAITSDLARRHGILFTCHSQPGQGSRFTLLLPKAPTAPGVPTP